MAPVNHMHQIEFQLQFSFMPEGQAGVALELAISVATKQTARWRR